MSRRPIYLDFNATTPLDPAVVEAMLPYLTEHFGNPSSAHAFGTIAKQAVARARAQMASLLGCHPAEILFTSGGTESNNQALFGAAATRPGGHFITSAIEHPAVSEPFEVLRARGHRVTVVPVDENGRVSPGDVEAALTPDTLLISIMHSNNEVGTLQPIEEVAALARPRGVLVHTDAAQSVGKVRVNVRELGVDFLSVAGHKLYAPKGVGALYVRSGVSLDRYLHGAGQESGRRAGTENVLEIVGLGAAAELAERELEARGKHLRAMRDRLWDQIRAGLDVRLNGHPEARLPNTLSVGFRGVDASALLQALSEKVAASAGSACHSDRVEVSAVLRAMGVPLEYARGTVRFSVGKTTTAEEIDQASAAVRSVITLKRSY